MKLQTGCSKRQEASGGGPVYRCHVITPERKHICGVNYWDVNTQPESSQRSFASFLFFLHAGLGMQSGFFIIATKCRCEFKGSFHCEMPLSGCFIDRHASIQKKYRVFRSMDFQGRHLCICFMLDVPKAL